MTSQPTWRSSSGLWPRRLFYPRGVTDARPQRMSELAQPRATAAQQLAPAAKELKRERTGRAPRFVTAVLAADALVVTLCGAFSERKKVRPRKACRAVRLRQSHAQLFATAADGSAVREGRPHGRRARSIAENGW